MKANIEISPLKVLVKIPSRFGNTDGYNEEKSARHYKDGWRDVVKPEITTAQKLGILYYDEENDVVTYEVINKSDEEIENETRQAIRSIYQSLHEIQGNETYQEFRVDLLRAVQKGNIEKAKLFEIEDLLEPIYSRVKKGNWDSANNKIGQTSINPDATVESWRQEAITTIENYINNNYDN